MAGFFTRDRKAGFIIYPLGDAIAQLLLGEISPARILVLSAVGGMVYAFEIPKWFSYIESRISKHWFKTIAAIIYFNPLWIARHLFFISVALNPSMLTNVHMLSDAVWKCLLMGTKSFAGAIILSLIGNYIIQNVIGLRHRFMASSVFSGLMAIYYALSVIL